MMILLNEVMCEIRGHWMFGSPKFWGIFQYKGIVKGCSVEQCWDITIDTKNVMIRYRYRVSFQKIQIHLISGDSGGSIGWFGGPFSDSNFF